MILCLVLLSTTLVDRAVALYGNDVVTLYDLRVYTAIHSLPSEGITDDTLREYARQVIINRLKLKEIDILGGIEVSEFEIDEALSDLPESVRTHPMIASHLREYVQQDLKLKKYVQKRFVPQVFVSPREISETYASRFEGDASPPPLEQVEGEIVQLLSLRKLNQLLKSWEEELEKSVMIRYLETPAEPETEVESVFPTDS
ncbi:MAG TPA: hypothetical protein PK014_12310 [Thermoanaerobaculia bacterium]|nr:hypothetical protein [Thermoanaerobaculia bacterium]HUM30836.1 hypothetical protein [Thermoanaerobaculia bacterium]HXK69183.1 hypothetical protein [Thermoanaerobaculia bacterium]